MIVDTSALMAIVLAEEGAEAIRDALLEGDWVLPAPALTEFWRVAARRGADTLASAEELIETLVGIGLDVAPYTIRHARIAHAANARYGMGMGQGGALNLLDLMVYAVAKERGQPMLCTGADFARTDIEIHKASRGY